LWLWPAPEKRLFIAIIAIIGLIAWSRESKRCRRSCYFRKKIFQQRLQRALSRYCGPVTIDWFITYFLSGHFSNLNLLYLVLIQANICKHDLI
jgi:hypothetical protein